MKKLSLLTLIVGLIMPLVLMTGCQQSVEPGKNDFPTLKEVKTLMQQNQNLHRSTAEILAKMTYEKKDWIKAVNKAYLEKSDLNAYSIKGRADLFKRVYKYAPPELQQKLDSGLINIYEMRFLTEYYSLLKKYMSNKRP